MGEEMRRLAGKTTSIVGVFGGGRCVHYRVEADFGKRLWDEWMFDPGFVDKSVSGRAAIRAMLRGRVLYARIGRKLCRAWFEESERSFVVNEAGVGGPLRELWGFGRKFYWSRTDAELSGRKG
jgi:hypothetical protein